MSLFDITRLVVINVRFALDNWKLEKANAAMLKDLQFRTRQIESLQSEIRALNECKDKLVNQNKRLIRDRSESQRREQAAVEAFESAAHNGNILCEFCGAECIDAGNDTGGDTDQCGQFVYSGSQQAGKGKRHENR